MSIEFPKVNHFCKLSASVIKNVLCFFNDQDEAIFASCCSLFKLLQNQNNKDFLEKHIRHWKKMVDSKFNVFKLPFSVEVIHITDDHLRFIDDDILHFLDLKTLSLCKNFNKINIEPLIDNPPIDEKVSAFITNVNSRVSLIFIDNVNRSEIETIQFPYNAIKIFHTDQQVGSRLEIITKCGKIIRYKPRTILDEEISRKEGFEKFEEISCIPEEIEKRIISSGNICLQNAFYVKGSYYFKWLNRQESRQSITFVENLNFPNKHIQLESSSNSCAVDHSFFYTASNKQITIYKGKNIWKRLEPGYKDASWIRLQPTNYGLGVTPIVKSANKYTHSLSIWDHKNNKSEKETPFFQVNEKFLTVKNNLAFYKENQKLSIYHIPKKEVIGTLSIPKRKIKDIIISSEPFPKHLIIYCQNLNDSDVSGNKSLFELLIFSLEENRE